MYILHLALKTVRLLENTTVLNVLCPNLQTALPLDWSLVPKMAIHHPPYLFKILDIPVPISIYTLIYWSLSGEPLSPTVLTKLATKILALKTTSMMLSSIALLARVHLVHLISSAITILDNSLPSLVKGG